MLTNCLNRIAKSLSLAFMLLALAMTSSTALSQTNSPAPAPATTTPPASLEQSNAERVKQRWILSTLIVALLGVGAVYLLRKPQNAAAK